MQKVLGEKADEAGRATDFIQRQTKLSGGTFTQMVVFGWMSNPDATLEELTQTGVAVGVEITPQGLDQRFTEEAAACLKQVLEESVRTVVAADPVAIPLLARFNGVFIADSTTVVLPDVLEEIWQGCGGSGPVAALKLQVGLELSSGRLDGPSLQDGRGADTRSEVQHRALPAGSLRITDLGYWDVNVLADIQQRQGYWLSRLKLTTALYDEAGQRCDLETLLREAGTTVVDRPIHLGAQQHLACRLLAVRVPPQVAAARRRKLKADARKKGQPLSRRRLALAHWTILVTNVPAEGLSLDEALVLLRARWQIERLFKLWKSHGHLDQSRSDKPWRVLCEVYAKMIGLVTQHWLLLVSCWHYPNRSLFKAIRTIQQQAGALASAFGVDRRLIQVVRLIARCLAVGCRINKRRAQPHTFQLLLQPDHRSLTLTFSIGGEKMAA
jgi:hypothetical protein